MSQFPSRDQPGSTPNPFAAGPPGYPPPRKSSYLWLWILLGLGGVGALVCCGCAGLMWFGVNKGLGIVESQIQAKLNDDPVVQEHLGTVRTTKMDFMASGEATQEAKKGGGDHNVIVFHVTGDKGKGDVIAEQAPNQQMVQNARLKLPTGEEFKLGF